MTSQAPVGLEAGSRQRAKGGRNATTVSLPGTTLCLKAARICRTPAWRKAIAQTRPAPSAHFMFCCARRAGRSSLCGMTARAVLLAIALAVRFRRVVKICSRWPPQREYPYSVRGLMSLKSVLAPTASGARCQHLGQTVPLSYLAALSNSGRKQVARGRCSKLRVPVRGDTERSERMFPTPDPARRFSGQ